MVTAFAIIAMFFGKIFLNIRLYMFEQFQNESEILQCRPGWLNVTFSNSQNVFVMVVKAVASENGFKDGTFLIPVIFEGK